MNRATFALLLMGCASPSPLERALAGRAAAMGAAAMGAEGAAPEGLLLSCAPKESEVLVDGVLQGSCEDLRGRVIGLEEGLHRVEIQRPGFATYRAELAVGRTRAALEVALVPCRSRTRNESHTGIRRLKRRPVRGARSLARLFRAFPSAFRGRGKRVRGKSRLRGPGALREQP